MLANRVKETSVTAGAGSLTLAGAATGFQTFNNAKGLNSRFSYWVVDTTAGAWETGIGYLSDATTLVRETVLDNSAGTLLALNFSSNSKEVFVGSQSKMQERRMLPVVSGQPFGSQGTIGGSGGSTNMSTDNMFYVPFIIEHGGRVKGIGCNITAAGDVGSKLRLGLYSCDTGGPISLLMESGDLDAGTTGFKQFSFSPTHLPESQYLVGLAHNSVAAVTYRALATGNPILGLDTGYFVVKNYFYENLIGGWTSLPASPTTSSMQQNFSTPKIVMVAE